MVANPALWLFQCLAPFGRLRRPPSGLGAFALPHEIIVMISTYLPEASVISLALTCWALHNLCFPQPLCLHKVEKEELLLLLEKDVANMYFCHYCVILHPWYRRWGRSSSSWIEEDLPCKTKLQHSYVNLLLSCYIPYNHARLVMNQHFYGPTHGPSLRKFRKKDWMPSNSGNVSSESLDARIIDDKLLVSSVKIMFHSRGDSKSLRDHVDSFGYSVCEHLTLAKGLPHYAPLQLPELAKDKDTPAHFAPCEQTCRSCTSCVTDYCIDISWSGRRKGYIIQVSVYRQIGDCRSPFDWSWRTMVNRRRVGPLRTAYPEEYRAGIAKDRWNKAEGIDTVTKGEWVEIPGLASMR